MGMSAPLLANSLANHQIDDEGWGGVGMLCAAEFLAMWSDPKNATLTTMNSLDELPSNVGTMGMLLLATLGRVYGKHVQDQIKVELKPLHLPPKGREPSITMLVISGPTLIQMAEFICKGMSRRHLLVLRTAIDRAHAAKPAKTAAVMEAIAHDLSCLAIQIKQRKRRPTRRKQLGAGKFERLHASWTKEALGIFVEHVANAMFELMADKGRMN
jgi:hypothetical protein